MKTSKLRVVLALLITLALMIGLLPMAVLADNDQTAGETNDNEETSDTVTVDSTFNGVNYTNGPAGSNTVGVVVYGEAVLEALAACDSDVTTFFTTLKDKVEEFVLGENLPTLELYLVDSNNNQYKLEENGVSATLLDTLQLNLGGDLSEITKYFGTDTINDTLKSVLQNAMSWMTDQTGLSPEKLYKVYGAKGIPAGTYTLQVRSFSKDGYTMSEPESGSVTVEVKDQSSINFVGSNHSLGEISYGFSKTIDLGWFGSQTLGFDVSADVSMAGIFLKTNKPGFGFKSVDIGSNALADTNFLMVNRDELEKMTKAMVSLGKDTFTNAIALVGTDSYTWSDLNILNNQLIAWDSDSKQLSLNYTQVYKLLTTYWSLISAASEEPMADFMSQQTDIRIPAILSATADENGLVTFNDDSNVTLKMSVDIICKIKDIAVDTLSDQSLITDGTEDSMITSVLNLVISMSKIIDDVQDSEFFDTLMNVVYAFLSSDDIASSASTYMTAIEAVLPLDDATKASIEDVLQYLPNHAILTSKMPSGHYILLETTTPEGYVRSPMCYTIDMEWQQDTTNLVQSCYVTVADAGIALPYLREDLYTYLRQADFASTADKLISAMTGGKIETIVEDALSGQVDITAATIAYWSNIIYANLGGKYVYTSEENLASDLTKYLYSHGRTVQNLMMFADKVFNANKNAITSQVDYNWKFYTFSTSLRTNAALAAKAVISGVAESLDDSTGNVYDTTTKKIVKAAANSIDTNNYLEAAVPNMKSTILTKIKTTAKTVVNKVFSKVGDLFKNMISKAVTTTTAG